MLKRTITAIAVAAVVAAMSATAALGHPGDAPAGEVTEVTWTLPAGQCKFLPKRLSLTGKGTQRMYTTIGADGSYTLVQWVNGTAKDNRGGRYKFDYANTFTTQSTVLPYTGIDADFFTLTGAGRANGLHTAFLENLTVTSEDPFVFSEDPIVTIGDPTHCDPI